jgi:histidinol-phosphate aminotransferase
MRFVVDLDNVHRYRPGGHSETIRRRYGLDEVVKLASNEFPLPPVAGVREAITGVLDTLNRYPDSAAGDLRAAISAHHGVPEERIAVGNGSLEVLLLLGQALLAPGVEAVFPAPSFSLYRKMCDVHGATAHEVPLRDHVADLDAMAAAIGPRTSLVILCNPNNPTGTYVAAADVARFVDAVPADVVVVLDEAYNEFVTSDDAQDSLRLLERHDNVCVTRTFSKIYGLCGLRIGYGLCSETLRAAIDTLRQPFNTSLVAQVAATEALRHQDEVRRRRRANAELRAHLVDGLAAFGVRTLPSEANFVLADVSRLTGDGSDVCERLTAMGAVVRDGAAFGLPGRVRVSVGTRDEIAFLLDKIGALAGGERRERSGRSH